MYIIEELFSMFCSILNSHVLTLRIVEKLRPHVAELIGIDMAVAICINWETHF